MSLMVLPPYCDIEGTNFAHWQYTLAFLLKDQLRELPEIRIPADSELEFGYDDALQFAQREVGMKAGAGFREIVKMGKVLEARRILWSTYNRKKDEWIWSAWLVDVPAGTLSIKFTAKSSSSWELICRMRNLILQKLHVKPTPEEKSRLDRLPTHSDAAMALVSRAFYDKLQGKPLSGVEATLRQALSLDPNFPVPRQMLAASLMGEDRGDEAMELLRPVISGDQATVRDHYLYGVALRSQGFMTLAREQFILVQRQRPKDALPCINLGELLGRERNDWEGALPLLKKAVELQPYNALAHEELGLAYAHVGLQERALEELRRAERYDLGEYAAIEITLAETYALLGDAPHAIPHYEQFVAGAARIGLNSPWVPWAKKSLAKLKERLSPHFVDAIEPHSFNNEELQTALREALTPSEYASVTNPFAVTAEMRKWAQELGRGAETDIDKAHQLYSGLVRHLNTASIVSYRTAEQAFQDWVKPQANLNCQDYTFLFVVLARELGLEAFYVQVNKDCQSNLVSHACAGVFIGGKCLLVDPAYQWFGAPHIDFEVHNDVGAIGVYLAQSPDLAQQRVAVKLLPGRAFPLFTLAANLASNGRLREARQVLDAGLKLDQDSWLSLMARGGVELYSGSPGAAIKDLQNALHSRVLYPELHYYLAQAFQADGKLEAARDEYRSFVQEQVDPELARDAWDQITRLNTALYNSSSTFEKTGAKRKEFDLDPNH